MTGLQWNRHVNGSETASGADWMYLITADGQNVVLTRWTRTSDRAARQWHTGEVARQAALYAIQLGGAYDEVPEAAAVVIAHMKQAAQVYESGGDVTGQPAWRHGH